MSIKKAIGFFTLGVCATATTVNVQFYDEKLPGSLNPLYAESMVDFRAQELYFDRSFMLIPSTINWPVKSYVALKWRGKKIRLFLNEGLKWHNGKT